MKFRRYIALILLSVYLFAAGGPAFASLTCECVAMHPRAAAHVDAGCSCCDHSGDALAAKADVGNPCCAHHHSTEIKLYTGSGSDDEHMVKCAVMALPHLLAAECPCPAHFPALRHVRGLPSAPLLCPALIAPRALRAPPVLV